MQPYFYNPPCYKPQIEKISMPLERSQPNQTFGCIVPIPSPTGTTFMVLIADAPDSQIDLSSVDRSILYPYSPEALTPSTKFQDYPKFTQKIKGSQIYKIPVKRYHKR